MFLVLVTRGRAVHCEHSGIRGRGVQLVTSFHVNLEVLGLSAKQIVPAFDPLGEYRICAIYT